MRTREDSPFKERNHEIHETHEKDWVIALHYKEEGVIYRDVGIHLKGGAGNFRKLDNQPSLTLNFDKFQQVQRSTGWTSAT